MSNAPHYDIDVQAFWADPYPDLARMRKDAPIAFVPQLGSTIFTRRDDIFTQEKRVDLFFSGRVTGSSTLRARGLAELKALERQGVTLDIPDAPLPRAQFYQRCAAAHLVWSPEGLGWDCFRHYEAPACGSVPLINQPWLDRHAPLIAGEHALYYDVEPGGLTRAVTAALADKAALARIAAAAQAHVMAHHTPAALARYVVEEARAL